MRDETQGGEPAPSSVANIGPRERAKRMRFGICVLFVGGCFGAAMVALQVDRLWRLFLLLPFWAGAVGVLQAREKT